MFRFNENPPPPPPQKKTYKSRQNPINAVYGVMKRFTPINLLILRVVIKYNYIRSNFLLKKYYYNTIEIKVYTLTLFQHVLGEVFFPFSK